MTEAEKAYEVLGGYTSLAVPIVILGLVLIGIVAMQIIFSIKFNNIALWIIPIVLSIAGGFSSFATMSYYNTYEEGLANSVENLIAAGYSDAATELQSMCPDFGTYSVTFLFLAIIFFIAMFLSFAIGVLQLVRSRNLF